tara:strand:- start:93 stop:404 length:312 start_codon:yes stop_codon:yes gene_type:complete
MKKKLQLTESQLIEFIENTVKKIKKEKQPKTIKLNESDLYKIVDKVAAEHKVDKKIEKPQVIESKEEKKSVNDKEEFRKLRESRRRRRIFESTKKGSRKKIIK